MTFKVLSDTALVIEVADSPGLPALARVRKVAAWLTRQALPAGHEIVPGLTAIAVHLPPTADTARVQARLNEDLATAGEATAEVVAESPRERVIPVVYGGDHGPDLARVADRAGMTVDEVIRRHTASVYHVMALGFAPGFPYLAGLDPTLTCPRLDTPRLRVPRGAVGIGGAQTGVYPQELPGGWNLIGRTAQALFDPAATDPAWLRVGDAVRFEPAEAGIDFAPAPTAAPPEPTDGRWVEVEEGGAQTTVQDQGRPGFQSIGVAEGGAVNQQALGVANLLVGNRANAAGLEFVLRGPVLRFRCRTWVALTGADLSDHPTHRPIRMEEGDVLDLSRISRSSWGYLAIAGGVDVPPCMTSASTHLPAGFGGFAGRALRAGDCLPVGQSHLTGIQSGWSASASVAGKSSRDPAEIRILRGPEADWFDDQTWQTFLTQDFRLSVDSNRMGFRLEGPPLHASSAREMTSQPVALGTLQLPPGGAPVVLMADRQSVGGYPRVASVVRADIAVLAQVPPGSRIRFVETTLAEAQTARRLAQRDLGLLVTGLRGRLMRRS